MKYSSALYILSLAVAALAAPAPADVGTRGLLDGGLLGGGNGGQGGGKGDGKGDGKGGDNTNVAVCSNQGMQQTCCNGGGLLGLSCFINILGKNCDGSTYCCDSNASQGGLININALNCVKVL